MREKVIILIIGITLLIIITGILTFTNKEEGNILKKIANLFESNNQEKKTEDKPSGDNTGGGTPDSSSSSSGTSSGGGGSSSSGGNTPPECETKPISYSLLKINKTETCNTNEGEICTNKTILCSLDIQNREDITNGNFKVELKFLGEGQNINEPIKTIVYEVFLEPQAKQHLESSTTVQSTGENGLANQIVNCFYKTLEVPEKCID